MQARVVWFFKLLAINLIKNVFSLILTNFLFVMCFVCYFLNYSHAEVAQHNVGNSPDIALPNLLDKSQETKNESMHYSHTPSVNNKKQSEKKKDFPNKVDELIIRSEVVNESEQNKVDKPVSNVEKKINIQNYDADFIKNTNKDSKDYDMNKIEQRQLNSLNSTNITIPKKIAKVDENNTPIPNKILKENKTESKQIRKNTISINSSTVRNVISSRKKTPPKNTKQKIAKKEGAKHLQVTQYEDMQIVNRPVYDYRSVIQSPSISKKQYGENNEHLPKSFYKSEYSSLLFVAVKSDNIQHIKALLEKGADINVVNVNNAYTPLVYAINQNRFNAFRYLIKRGADVNRKGYEGKTPLHIAVIDNKYNFLKVILDESNVDVLIKDDNDKLALEYMDQQMLEDEFIIESIIRKYHNINQALLDFSYVNSYKGVQYLLRNGADVNTISKSFPFDTPLLNSTKRGNLPIVNLLLFYGANPDICNKYQESAISIAKNTNQEIYEILKTISIKNSLKNETTLIN